MARKKCVTCGRAVNYPGTLDPDGHCEDCKKAQVFVPVRRCTCGVEIAKASTMCPEADCFYR